MATAHGAIVVIRRGQPKRVSTMNAEKRLVAVLINSLTVGAAVYFSRTKGATR
jgi:hypothetical protein